ncbi:MAG: hypothetical protein ACK559_10605, partial [bacterium]
VCPALRCPAGVFGISHSYELRRRTTTSSSSSRRELSRSSVARSLALTARDRRSCSARRVSSSLTRLSSLRIFLTARSPRICLARMLVLIVAAGAMTCSLTTTCGSRFSGVTRR